jgi:dimeric dUTPase (all-alpha-NTP-PPase superfamily)
MPLFGDWLKETRALQVESYGTDPVDLEGEDLAVFLRWNFLAAHTELSEALAELPWKPWSQKHKERLEDSRGLTEWDARDRAVDEIVDVLHFIANILVALDIDDEDINNGYINKMHINAQRQREHY